MEDSTKDQKSIGKGKRHHRIPNLTSRTIKVKKNWLKY